MKKKYFQLEQCITIIIIILFLIIPYLRFGKDLYIGGDDTRLFYSYPFERLKNIAWSSRFHFSGTGSNNSQHFMIPILLILSFLKLFLEGFVIQNLAISTILIGGFFSMKKLLSYIFKETGNGLSILLALLYITSPILSINQLSGFLYSIRLIPLIPFTLYNILKYFNESKNINLLYALIVLCILSLGVFSIPWLLGFIIPMIIPFLIYVIKNFKTFSFKKLFIFIILFLLSQSFWLIPFATQFIYTGSSSISDVLSKETSDTFTPTVIATSHGNSIVDPIRNNFHRSIQKNFSWQSYNLQTLWYDKTYYLSYIYIIIIIFGIIFSNNLSSIKREKFYLVLIGFLISLFLFTVKIGFLEEVFLGFGKIPGFVMFRNFYDKFALGYLILFIILLYRSLIIIKNINKNLYIVLLIIVSLLLGYTSIPFIKGDFLNTVLWQTNDIKNNISIPNEYFKFLSGVKEYLLPIDALFISPYGISSYSYIHGENQKEYFIGRSPVEIFIGNNDFSGRFSFPGNTVKKIEEFMKLNKCEDLFNLLEIYNIKYIIHFPNLDQNLLNSYLFDQSLNGFQGCFTHKDFTKRLLISEFGNYELYKITHFSNKDNLNINQKNFLRKISGFKYEISLTITGNNQTLVFKDSFHQERKLYPSKGTQKTCETIIDNQCINQNYEFFKGDELTYLFKKSFFKSTHTKIYDYANQRTIDRETILNHFPKNSYTLNNDGSMIVNLTLYFRPQSRFYLGIIISGTTLLGILFWVGRNFRKRKTLKSL